MTEFFILVVGSLRAFLRRDTDLLLENLALRHQLQVVLRSRAGDRRLQNRRPVLWVWIRWILLRAAGSSILFMVRPETVIGWHRRGRRRYWTWRSRAASSGRPRLTQEVSSHRPDGVRESDVGDRANPRGTPQAGHPGRSALDPPVPDQDIDAPSEPDLADVLEGIRRRGSGPPTCWWCRRSASGPYVLFLVSHARRELISLM